MGMRRRYQISYKFKNLTEQAIYKLTVKQNHKIIDCYRSSDDEYNNETILELEYGESLNFEFYNENEYVTAVAEIVIDILKLQ